MCEIFWSVCIMGGEIALVGLAVVELCIVKTLFLCI